METKNPTGNNVSPQVESILERYGSALGNYSGPDRVISSIEFAELARAKEKTKVALKSGLPSLDVALDGFVSGELVVVSGPTGMGKTLLCDTLIRNFRNTSHFSLFFSFEVTPETIALAHDTQESVVFLPLSHKQKDISWIWERCLEAKVKYGCEAVFIDHLHYLIDMGSQHNMSLEIGRVMRNLKKIALDTGLVIFIVCHIKSLDIEQEPSIHSLRDSSFVGQEADSVILVWRRWDLDMDGKKMDTMLQGLALLKVDKARRAGTMNAKIAVRKEGRVLIESQGEPEPPKRRRSDKTGGDEWWNK